MPNPRIQFYTPLYCSRHLCSWGMHGKHFLVTIVTSVSNGEMYYLNVCYSLCCELELTSKNAFALTLLRYECYFIWVRIYEPFEPIISWHLIKYQPLDRFANVSLGFSYKCDQSFVVIFILYEVLHTTTGCLYRKMHNLGDLIAISDIFQKTGNAHKTLHIFLINSDINIIKM